MLLTGSLKALHIIWETWDEKTDCHHFLFDFHLIFYFLYIMHHWLSVMFDSFSFYFFFIYYTHKFFTWEQSIFSRALRCIICSWSAKFIGLVRISTLHVLYVCSHAYFIIIIFFCHFVFAFALVILCFIASFLPSKSIYEGNLGCGYLKERRASGLIFCENTSSLYRTLFVSFWVAVAECCNRHACVDTVHVFQHVFNTSSNTNYLEMTVNQTMVIPVNSSL